MHYLHCRSARLQYYCNPWWHPWFYAVSWFMSLLLRLYGFEQCTINNSLDTIELTFISSRKWFVCPLLPDGDLQWGLIKGCCWMNSRVSCPPRYHLILAISLFSKEYIVKWAVLSVANIVEICKLWLIRKLFLSFPKPIPETKLCQFDVF